MKAQIAIQSLLTKKLSEIQKTNPRYSVRAFARKTGLNSGALSAILNGKRNVSFKLAQRISEKLMLDPQERSEVLMHFPKKRSKQDVVDPSYLQLNASYFRVIADWEHFAILSLMNTKDFKSDIVWISNRLSISDAAVTQAFHRLIQVGLVEMKDGLYVRGVSKYRTSDDVADLSVKKAHEQTLDLARESLYRDSIAQRDFSSVTMAIDPAKLAMAKQLIRKFQDELSELVESGNQTEVYRLSMQMFPLTKLTGEIK